MPKTPKININGANGGKDAIHFRKRKPNSQEEQVIEGGII